MPPRNLEQTALVPPAAPSGGKTWLGLAVGLVVAAGVAAGIVLAILPKKGTLNIEVVDSKGESVDALEVYLDGRREGCETSPCILRDVPASPHDIKVKAAGYEKAEPKHLELKGGEDAKVSYKLTKSGGETKDDTKQAATKGTGFKVTSPGNGLHVFVDGKDRGALPATITDLAAGTYKITVVDVFDDVKKRHYEAFEKSITVKADEVVDLGEQKLKVLTGRITLDLATAGAKVFLVSGSDRRAVPDKFPAVIEIPTAKSYTLEATKAGFDDFKQPLEFVDGQAEKSITINMTAKGAAPATTAATTATTAATATTTATAATTTAPAGGDTMVTLNSVPPSKVVLDGKPLGDTPQKVKVASGSHTALFINSDQGMRETVPFSTKGEATKVVIGRKK